LKKLISNYIEPEIYGFRAFCLAGGLAIGMEKSWIKCVALEIDKWACQTFKKNHTLECFRR
jgi:site-specific DNA-cytosine methylase